MLKYKLNEVWRDDFVLSEIRAEIKYQAMFSWRPWEILLPPDLLYPMLQEISQGMAQEWSPVLDGVPVQLGSQGEIAIRFVLVGEKTSPVMVKSMRYSPSKKDNIIPIEVNSGNKIRV